MTLFLLITACDAVDTDAADTGWWPEDGATADPFADEVVSFEPGDGAGFGQDALPDVVLGPPLGVLAGTPSLDVLSLGRGGVLVLRFHEPVVDHVGADFIVFENPMPAWKETAFVSVRDGGGEWVEFPCDPGDDAGDFPGCAGVSPVFGGPGAADPTNPAVSGGDAFDLADIGVAAFTELRLTDSGVNTYDGATGGFDLDAVSATRGE